MIAFRDFYRLLIFFINIFFLFYYSLNLIIFTDEFAINNIGFFNHAVAGLSEIIGIIFFSLAIGLIVILFKKYKNQSPLLVSIFLIEFLIAINFWRYVLTNSPGESDIMTISKNALIFSLMAIISILIIFEEKRKK
tara:strand:- start:868 stop:1275 length:408 start_codon:yes stop_codon:yes gene_type:complete